MSELFSQDLEESGLVDLVGHELAAFGRELSGDQFGFCLEKVLGRKGSAQGLWTKSGYLPVRAGPRPIFSLVGWAAEGILFIARGPLTP